MYHKAGTVNLHVSFADGKLRLLSRRR
jgi:hypothetical protein